MNVTDASGFTPSEEYKPFVTASKNISVPNDGIKFKERKHFRTGSLEYERHGDNPGKILIFNMEFKDSIVHSERKGSRRDVNQIILCFQRSGFNIEKDDICSNYTTKEVLTKLDEVSKMDLSDTNSLLIFFLTHGSSGGQLDTKDDKLNFNEILEIFRNCTYLEGKPKMFVFQSCKGNAYSGTGNTTAEDKNLKYKEIKDKFDEVKNSPLVPLNVFENELPEDMLIFFSSVEGTVSFRHPIRGSWIIQELCHNVSSYAQREDMVSILTRTIKCISFNHSEKHEYKEDVFMKQLPVFLSTLRKKFYINTNKHRNIMLKMADDIENIKKTLSELEKIAENVQEKSQKKK